MYVLWINFFDTYFGNGRTDKPKNKADRQADRQNMGEKENGVRKKRDILSPTTKKIANRK